MSVPAAISTVRLSGDIASTSDAIASFVLEGARLAGRDRSAVRQRVAEFGRKPAVDGDEPGAADLVIGRQKRARRLDRRAIGRVAQRRGVVHRRAQVGIMPGLDPPGRQPRGGETLERRSAARRSRQRFQRLELLDDRGFRRRSGRNGGGRGHQAASTA